MSKGDRLLSTDIHKDLGWYISLRYRFGIDYKLNEHLSLRAGFTMDERGMEDANIFTLGMAHHF